MELEFELDDYCNGEHREFGATLYVNIDLHQEKFVSFFHGLPAAHNNEYYEIVGAQLITYDQDGGESRHLDDVDPFEYIDESELVEEIQKNV